MDVPAIEPLELSDHESKLFALVNFSEREMSERPPRNPQAMFAASEELTHLLLDRGVIPDVRLRYFTDADLNVGGRGKSRQDVFIRNGCTGDGILRSPHFLKYLRYFVLGPVLPVDVIAGFRQLVLDDRGTSGEVMSQLGSYARAKAKLLKSPVLYDLHEEFYKLALECGVDEYVASTVRKAAQSAR